ncbi:prenyltransferase [bacterium]|nr:prenyltransferase [bacterium]
MNKIKTFFKNSIFWLECARVYTLPITILSWLVIFVYSIKHHGNIIAGLIALIGIGFVHLATNLADDYFDYAILTKDDKFIQAAQECKCSYLKSNKATLSELRNVIILYLLLAALIGLILFLYSGPAVFGLALIGLLIAIGYQKLSTIGMGEIAVIIAFGPLMFEGVYYVMTKNFSLDAFILSIACVLFVNTILYAHMLMDFDGDECSHKTTLCQKFKTKKAALNFILFFYILSYIIISILAQNTGNYFYYLTYLTIPMVIDLYNSLNLYNKDKTTLPTIYPWHYPLDNWKEIKNTENAPFYFRFFYSRNIVTAFMLLTCIAILAS